MLCSIWLQKSVLLHFFLRTFDHLTERSHHYILWLYSSIFFGTWTAAQIVGFAECDPANLYWKVSLLLVSRLILC
jgi:hypothetical protein